MRVYQIGKRIEKRDKFGIHSKIEAHCIDILALGISASFSCLSQKLPVLIQLRTKTEIVKHLIRTEYDIHAITEENYVELQCLLQEISKMTAGWIKYITQKGPVGPSC